MQEAAKARLSSRRQPDFFKINITFAKGSNNQNGHVS